MTTPEQRRSWHRRTQLAAIEYWIVVGVCVACTIGVVVTFFVGIFD